MRNQLNPTFFLTFFLLFLLGCTQEGNNDLASLKAIEAKYAPLIEAVKTNFTPDQRTDRFRVELAKAGDSGCPILRGHTTNAAASKALFRELEQLNFCYTDSLRILPSSLLGPDTLAIVNVSVANLRTQPRHSAELTTQALLGMPLVVYDRQGDWFLVQTPDYYIAWLEAGAFVRGNRQMLKEYFSGDLAYLEQSISAKLTASPGGGKIIRDISPGNIFRSGELQGESREIFLPDGSSAYLPDAVIRTLSHWQRKSSRLELSLTAAQFYGQPYLWGGTSAKSMDCSGFTKMTYLMNGYVIPRDASQQVLAGTEVNIVTDDPAYSDDNLNNLQADDLLFFGNLRDDGSQRITHVGIYLGDGRFVHAGADNGFIREESLYRSADDYAPHRRQSLLRAKRLAIGSQGVIPLTEILDQYR